MSHLQQNPFVSPTGKKTTCMEMLQVILDGQSTDEQRTYFKTHMEGCMPCFKNYNLDNAIKELIKSKCCGEGAPDDLVSQIKNQLSHK